MPGETFAVCRPAQPNHTAANNPKGESSRHRDWLPHAALRVVLHANSPASPTAPCGEERQL